MKKIGVLCCIFIFIICSSCFKQNIDEASSGLSSIKVGEPAVSNLDYDDYKVLLYEGNDGLKEIKKDELEEKTFKSGTKIKIGIVFYKDGKEVAKTYDDKSQCQFTESTLKEGENKLEVRACKIDSGSSGGEGGGKVNESNPPTGSITQTGSCNEGFIKWECRINEEIAKGNTFYRDLIDKIQSISVKKDECPDKLLEVICKPKTGPAKPLVLLACISERAFKFQALDWGFEVDDNDFYRGRDHYTAACIGEVKIL